MLSAFSPLSGVGLFFYAWRVPNTFFKQPFSAGYFVKALSGIAIFIDAIRVWTDLLTSRLGPVQWAGGEVAARLSLLGAAMWVWIDYAATGTNASQPLPENGLACTSGILLLAIPIWLALA